MKQIRLVATVLVLLIIFSFTLPAYAVVTSLKTDKTLYIKNMDTTMTFTGTAGEEDINEIVTVVIYGPGNIFIKPALSGIVSSDRTFEIKMSEKNFANINSHGTYNATGFMTYQKKEQGLSVMFDYSTDGNPVRPTSTTTTSQPSQTSSQSSTTPSSSTSQTSSSSSSTSSSDSSDGEKSIQEKIQERIEAAKKQQSTDSDSGDSEKTIEEKIKERIEAAKNQGKTDTEVPTEEPTPTPDDKPAEKPEEVKTPNSSTNNQDFDLMVLYIAIGLGAAAAVGVAIYGMKLKPKFLAKVVSDTSTGTQTVSSTDEEDYSLMILKNRLAKGEISVQEFNELKRALSG
jgi:hypothetical protein